MTVTEFEDKDIDQLEQGLDFQHIRARIKNTLNLPIDNLDRATGAATDQTKYVRSTAEPKDDLVSIFRRMLDLGSPEYEHQLAEFLHKGPPKMRYEPVKTEVEVDTKAKPVFRTSKSWTFIDHEDPNTKAKEAAYFEEQRREKERRGRIADKIKTFVVTKKEDLAPVKTPGQYDYFCYTPSCGFGTDDKKDYERHVVTCHYGKGLCYPGKVDIRQRGWTAQGRKWEI